MAWRALLLGVLMISCGREPEGLPDDLLGVWRTREAPYQDSYLELHPGVLIFGADLERFSAHPIRSVQSRVLAEEVEYALDYVDEAGEILSLTLTYTLAEPPRLRVGRRSQIWVPESEAVWLAKGNP